MKPLREKTAITAEVAKEISEIVKVNFTLTDLQTFGLHCFSDTALKVHECNPRAPMPDGSKAPDDDEGYCSLHHACAIHLGARLGVGLKPTDTYDFEKSKAVCKKMSYALLVEAIQIRQDMTAPVAAVASEPAKVRPRRLQVLPAEASAPPVPVQEVIATAPPVPTEVVRAEKPATEKKATKPAKPTKKGKKAAKRAKKVMKIVAVQDTVEEVSELVAPVKAPEPVKAKPKRKPAKSRAKAKPVRASDLLPGEKIDFSAKERAKETVNSKEAVKPRPRKPAKRKPLKTVKATAKTKVVKPSVVMEDHQVHEVAITPVILKAAPVKPEAPAAKPARVRKPAKRKPAKRAAKAKVAGTEKRGRGRPRTHAFDPNVHCPKVKPVYWRTISAVEAWTPDHPLTMDEARERLLKCGFRATPESRMGVLLDLVAKGPVAPVTLQEAWMCRKPKAYDVQPLPHLLKIAVKAGAFSVQSSTGLIALGGHAA